MQNDMIFLDSYTLQSDLRIRLPKSAIENISAVPGKTKFKIYYDPDSCSLILKKVVADKAEVNKIDVK